MTQQELLIKLDLELEHDSWDMKCIQNAILMIKGIKAVTVKDNKTCKWELDDPDDETTYISKCGCYFTFSSGGLKDNDFKFCYKCGKSIEEVKER